MESGLNHRERLIEPLIFYRLKTTEWPAPYYPGWRALTSLPRCSCDERRTRNIRSSVRNPFSRIKLSPIRSRNVLKVSTKGQRLFLVSFIQQALLRRPSVCHPQPRYGPKKFLSRGRINFTVTTVHVGVRNIQMLVKPRSIQPFKQGTFPKCEHSLHHRASDSFYCLFFFFLPPRMLISVYIPPQL